MAETPFYDKFMREYYPRLTPEGQAKVKRLMAEYGIGHRDLTKKESEEASFALVAIVKANTKT